MLSGILGKSEEPKGVLSEVNSMVTLSTKHRIMGFGICVGLGLITSILSSLFVAMIVANPIPFALFYTISNIFFLASTCFLMGPLNQLKKMVEPSRLICTIIYVASMVLTLVSALVWGNAGLVIIFVIIQICALFWYSISYIPGAQTCVKSTATKIFV
eukprot:TRINITY_DN23225_c0_g1_i1.p1 TRINITY_DN23225_c0_g1~~TRINITY_DN23225_c0_g1_i1.p1  ORF type:complete len:158 (-),score=27.88 TRINITY_DN23225_c0_g1_i1:47-520(-)